jgi:hypothetical protein
MLVRRALLLLTIVLVLLALPASANANSGVLTVSPTTSAVDEFSFSDVLGSIADTSPELSTIVGVAKTTNVQFLELHLLKGYDPKALDFAPAQNNALTRLRAAVGRNKALAAKLRRAGFLLSDVVAILRDPAGKLFVFINL